MTKLIGHARVSTRPQSAGRQQQIGLLAAGVRTDNLCVDPGISGVRSSRPQFDRALASPRERYSLVIATLDRRGRSGLMLAFADELRIRGASLRDDTSPPMGSTLVTVAVMAALAQGENENKRECVSDSIAKRRAADQSFGGRPRILVDSHIRRALKLVERGAPAAQAARGLGGGPVPPPVSTTQSAHDTGADDGTVCNGCGARSRQPANTDLVMPVNGVGLPARPWTSESIEPTHANGDSFGWLLDGRIELASRFPAPIVAWSILDVPRSKSGRTVLGTFHLNEHGSVAIFNLWELPPQRPSGRWIAALIKNRDVLGRVIPYPVHPYNPRRKDASPLLCELYDDAVERATIARTTGLQRRGDDPLIDVLDQLVSLAADHAVAEGEQDDSGMTTAHTQIRELVGDMNQSDAQELLVRLALMHAQSLCDADDYY